MKEYEKSTRSQRIENKRENEEEEEQQQERERSKSFIIPIPVLPGLWSRPKELSKTPCLFLLVFFQIILSLRFSLLVFILLFLDTFLPSSNSRLCSFHYSPFFLVH